MSIQALNNFRQKFPAYANKSDEELAGALASKYPEAYGKLPTMVANEKVISGYTPMSQESARMAEDRTNMWSKLGEELTYNPLADKTKSIPARIKNYLLKNPTLAIKALGALGQSEESLVSSPIVAAQRGLNPLQPEFYETIGRAVTGEAPTEYGDIARNAGVPESVAASVGLLASSAVPGSGNLIGGVNKILKSGKRVVSNIAENAGEKVAKTHLTLLSREHPEAAAWGLEHNWSMIKPGQKVADIESEITTATAKAERSARAAQTRASRVYDYGLSKARNDAVDLAPGNVIADAERKAIEDLGARWVTKGKKGTMIFKGNNRITGSDKLAAIIQDVGTRKQLTVGNLRVTLKELDSLIGQAGESAASKAVRAQATELGSRIRQAINTQSATMGEFNTRYQGMIKHLNPDEANKLPGVFDLLKAKTQGGTKLGNYFELPIEAKTVLEKFNASLPQGRKFLNQLKDASTNAAFKQLKPKAGFSLMGPVAAGYLAATNPAYLPALALGVGASSPRMSALMYKRMAMLGKGSNALRAKFVGTPAGQAIEILTSRGVLAPAVVRGVTREQFNDGNQ